MECAAVDGRGGAVHSHGALHAPLRTADSELRRPSQGKEPPSRRSPVERGRRRREGGGAEERMAHTGS